MGPRPNKRRTNRINDPNFVPKIIRSYGRTRDCKGCRFWSEQHARQVGNSQLQCLCLNRNSPHVLRYTRFDTTCDEWQEGSEGAIDDPETGNLYRSK